MHECFVLKGEVIREIPNNLCGEILGEMRNLLFFYFELAIFLNVRSAA